MRRNNTCQRPIAAEKNPGRQLVSQLLAATEPSSSSASDSSITGVASPDVIAVGRVVRCELLQAKLRLLKKPNHRNSMPNKTTLAIKVFFTRAITDKLESNTDRINNKRYEPPKKQLT